MLRNKHEKTSRLRQLIESRELEFLMEAHNGLSARIAGEAGFKGIWASSLSISAALGVRDCNEASWTQVLDTVEFMNDATDIPILLDGDTGYGNFNNIRRLIKKLEQRDVAGVCVEDKLFPKTNSFINGESQQLANIDEFSGKIKAAKDTQSQADFVVVARVEAFIAGLGLDEALKRAEAYRQAGADALLIHSKKTNSSDIDEFMREWHQRLPIIIVPTTYNMTPTDHFRDIRVSMVIWANHNLRASIKAMQEVTRLIRQKESVNNVEDKIVPVSEVFRLQGEPELRQAEKKYLPVNENPNGDTTKKKIPNTIILAASQGALGELTREVPKTLLRVSGKSILETQVDLFRTFGVSDILVVRGFAKEKVAIKNVKTIDNDNFANTKDLYSLFLARESLRGDTIISYGDVIFKPYLLNEILNDESPITIAVDAEFEIQRNPRGSDFIKASRPYSKQVYFESVNLIEMSANLAPNEIHGEFVGLWKVTDSGAKVVRETLEHFIEKPNFNELTTADLFNAIAQRHPISVRYAKDCWLGIDSLIDFERAGSF